MTQPGGEPIPQPVPEAPRSAPESPRPEAPRPESQRMKNLRERAKDARSALEGDAATQQVQDRGQSERVVNDVFDETLDVRSGTPVESKGIDRKNMAQNGLNRVDTLLESGYENLSAEDQAEVREQIATALNKTPGTDTVLEEISSIGNTPAEKEALKKTYLEELVKEPDFRQAIHDIRQDIISKKPDMGQYNEQVEPVNPQDIEEIDGQIKNIDKQMREFSMEVPEVDENGGVTMRPGEKWKDLQDALGIMNDGRADYEAKNMELEEKLKEAEIDRSLFPDLQKLQLQAEAYLQSVDPNAISRGNQLKEVLKIDKELKNSSYETAKVLYDDLVTEQGDLITKKVELSEAKVSLQVEGSLAENPGGHSEKQLARADAEQDYADEIANVFSESMEKYMVEREGYMDAAQQVRLITEADREPDSMKKALKFANANYWGCHSIDRDGKLVDNINKVNVLDSLNLLTAMDSTKAALHFINPATGKMYTPVEVIAEAKANPKFPDQFGTGPDAVMRQLTMSQINPDTGVNYTLAEINAKLVADPEFFSKDQNDVVTNLIRKGVITKQISRNMTQNIINAPGLGGEEFLKGILASEEVRAVYDKKGYTANLLDMFKDKKKLPWMVGLILAFGPVGGLAAIMVAAKIKG